MLITIQKLIILLHTLNKALTHYSLRYKKGNVRMQVSDCAKREIIELLIKTKKL